MALSKILTGSDSVEYSRAVEKLPIIIWLILWLSQKADDSINFQKRRKVKLDMKFTGMGERLLLSVSRLYMNWSIMR